MDKNIFDERVDSIYDLMTMLECVLADDFSVDKYDDSLSEELAQTVQISEYYLALFRSAKDYIEENKILSRIDNADIRKIHSNTLNLVYKSLYSIKNAFTIKNYAFAMRIMNYIYSTIVKSYVVSINKDNDGYPILEDFNKVKKDISIELVEKESGRSILEKFKTYMNQELNEEFKNDVDFDKFMKDDLKWAHKLFAFNEVDFLNYDINDEMLAYKIGNEIYPEIGMSTKPYLEYNGGDFYFDSINSACDKYNFIKDYRHDIDENDLHSLEIQAFDTYRLIADLINNYIQILPFDKKLQPRILTITNDIKSLFNKDLKIDVDKGFIKERESEAPALLIKHSDPVATKILIGKTKSASNKDFEKINKYFTTYREKFIVNNDVCLKNKRLARGPLSATNMAIKYLNLFESIDHAMFYQKGDKLASKKFYSEIVGKEYDDYILNKKYVYIEKNKEKNAYSLNTIYLRRKIRSFCNICNSIIIDDVANAVREGKMLFNYSVISTYINAKTFKELVSDNQECTVSKDFFDESIKFMKKHITSWKERTLSSKTDEGRTKSGMKLEGSEIYKDSNYEVKEFAFTGDDSIKSIKAMQEYIKKTYNYHFILANFDLYVSMYFTTKTPYYYDRVMSDTEKSIMILDFANLLSSTLDFDAKAFPFEISDKSNLKGAIKYMIDSDIDRLLNKTV
jgi:hypothetical protein